MSSTPPPTEGSVLHRTLVEQTSSISSAVLKDINWDVKVVLCSDKLSTINLPIATVTFDILTETEGLVTRKVEMDKSELSTFIQALETANKAVLQLQT